MWLSPEKVIIFVTLYYLKCCSQVHPFESKLVKTARLSPQHLKRRTKQSPQYLSPKSFNLNFFVTILLSKYDQNYKCTDIYYFSLKKSYICWSWDDLVLNPWVIKAWDHFQDRVIDIQVQDQAKLVSRLVSRPRPVSRPSTLLLNKATIKKDLLFNVTCLHFFLSYS